MAFDFPANPTVGQVYNGGAAVFRWNGYAWVGGPGAPVTGAQPVPEAPTDGEIYGRQGSTSSWQLIPPSGISQIFADANYVNVGGDTMTGALALPGTGSQTSASLHFGGATTGLFGSATAVNITVSGTARLLIDATKITPTLPLRAFDGTAGAPAYSFNSNNNLGIFRAGADALGIAVGGGQRVTFQSSLMTCAVPIMLPADPTLPLHAVTKQYADANFGISLATADARYVGLDGDTMLGFLTLHANPVNSMHPTTKQYVDTNFASIGYVDAKHSLALLKTGGTMTGAITLSGDPTQSLHAATKQYVDVKLNLSGGTMTGPLYARGSIGGISSPSPNPGLEIRSNTSSDAAYITLHRVGAFACLFGLDTDNQLAYGGWSFGAARRIIWDTGNLNPYAYAPLGGAAFSGGISAPWMSVTGAGYYTGSGYLTIANTTRGDVYALSGSGSAQIGGCLGYSAGNQYYGISGYGGNSFYGAGQIDTSGEVRGASYVRSMGQTMIAVGHPVISATANAYMNSGGTLQRISSSTFHKTDIETMEDTFGDKILQLRPVFYRPQFTNDFPGFSRFGFLAEECHDVDPRFANTDRKVMRDENGKTLLERKPRKIPNPEHLQWHALPHEEREKIPSPEPEIMSMELTGEVVYDGDEMEPTGLDLNGIVAALVNLVQRQEARIRVLERRVA